jgi:hypothetical protein
LKIRIKIQQPKTCMKISILHWLTLLAACLITSVSLLGCATARKSSSLTANPADVDTIPDIMRVSYETISGPKGARVQLERDRTLYLPGAIFVGGWEAKGKIKTQILTPEQYRLSLVNSKAAYEKEIGRRIERYGKIAEVRSVSAVRAPTPDGPVTERYVVYSQLYWDSARWWITGQVWEQETPGNLIPESWIGKWEDMTH